MIYWLHLAGRYIASTLPLPVSYWLAARGGSLVYYAWGGKRRNAVANFRRAVGPRAAGRTARRSFQNFGRYLIDMLRLSGRQITQAQQRVRVVGFENLEAARAGHRGLVVVGGHFGNADLGAAILAGRGFPVTIIAETLQPPRWDALVQRTRHEAGIGTIPPEAGARAILGILRRNEVLALLVDRPTHQEGDGVAVRFFGAWTRVPSGPATLALRTGAGLVAACVYRTRKSYTIQVSPPLVVERSGDVQADVQRLTQLIMDTMEGFIRRRPDQWFMFRAMWPDAPQ